jgi:hypothetical protein
MKPTFSNQSSTSSVMVRAVDAVVAISTTILASLFIVAILLVPFTPALI